MMEQLPDDILADVLGRLPPRSLAASRCVRKHWCSIIDGRRLLRTDLLPLRLDAFYCIDADLLERLTYFFARPSTARRIPGGPLNFLGPELHNSHLEVEDHCNGMLLFNHYMVVNPATRQWIILPDYQDPAIEIPPSVTIFSDRMENDDDGAAFWVFSHFYLVYDPMAESAQNYEVFNIPVLVKSNQESSGSSSGSSDHHLEQQQEQEEQEWPPSIFTIQVFSSRSWMWEVRSFVRQGEPAGTIADMLRHSSHYPHRTDNRKAVYHHGALYVHCQNDSVMRISLSNNKYQMIRSPAAEEPGSKHALSYLGKSEKGVYSALLDRDWDGDIHRPQFRVWLLKEEGFISHDNKDGHILHMEWVLKTNINLQQFPRDSSLSSPILANQSARIKQWRIIRNFKNNSNKEYEEEEDEEYEDEEYEEEDEEEEEEAPPSQEEEEEEEEEVAPPSQQEEESEDEWNFDNDGILLEEDNDACPFNIDFFGFHPYKEIVFFHTTSGTISFDLNTSKSKKLGDIHMPVGLKTSFPYTACWIGDLFKGK